ncbi:lysine--tRNA ligase [candidate division SR1 bacterium]|nr:lysine--tRNA ligase [candidate division SR1 bacterium]
MAEQLSEREVRIQKVVKMKAMGVIPFAQSYDKTHLISDIIKQYEKADLRDIETIITSPVVQVSTAGRLTLYRSHGKLAFARLLDSTEQIQLMFHRDNCKINIGGQLSVGLDFSATPQNDDAVEMTAYKFMEKMVDMGDFIGVKGEVFRTHKGELTIFVSEFSFLSKSIRGLPEKYHGLSDPEELYRKRYLDMTMNPETYKRFLFKSKFYQTLREFYTQEGFIEIQTPILDNAASGAAARPFVTHHNDYDVDVYLRIAFETSLKKATVGRFEKVFEIGQDFRNEGSDPSHLQEFTQVEHYAVYRNYEDNMRFTEKMLDYLFEKLKINKKLKVKDKEGIEKEVDFTTPRERIDYTKGVNEASGLDISQYGEKDADKLRSDIRAKGIEFEGMDEMGTTTLIDYLYKKVLRPKIIGPAFIYNYPVIMQPLARVSDKDSNIVEQFQLLVNGREICKAYSELVDPLLQQANFDKQAESEDEETTSGDDAFVEAMEYGMPPQSGFGMGLERILAILTEQDNLRDVVMFPLMKPRNEE